MENFLPTSISNSWSLRFMGDLDVYLGLEPSLFFPFKQVELIEAFLFRIMLGLIPIPLVRLFITAYLQDKR